ncbi:PUA-like domain-containing protein [Hysterangium stoloniferum]|nr:PUA-like domain-containing protein [Hysterangium stoloniferum]
MVDFAAIRAKNIANNKALLISMGLEKAVIPASRPKNASTQPKKRKVDASDANTPAKAAKVSKVAVTKAGRENVGNMLGKRLHDPKTFGDIPGVEVGTWWGTRTDAIHAPFVAGIAGSAMDGAYSVALSGGYDDDVDLGYALSFSVRHFQSTLCTDFVGEGGRDLKGTKANPKNLRTAPQSCDQSFDNPMNAALKRSVKTKKPVRVIRGYKLRSPYAPETGYRYDGLYTVEKAWLERGLNKEGYKVCKYAFKRIPGQSPLLVSGSGPDDAESGEDDAKSGEDDAESGEDDEEAGSADEDEMQG